MPTAGTSADSGTPVHTKFTQNQEQPGARVPPGNRSPPRTTKEVSSVSDRPPTRDDAGARSGNRTGASTTSASSTSDRGGQRRRTEDTGESAQQQSRRRASGDDLKRSRTESSSSASSLGRNDRKYTKNTTLPDGSRSAPGAGSPVSGPNDDRHHHERALAAKEPVQISTKESADGVLVYKDEEDRAKEETKEVRGGVQASSTSAPPSASGISYSAAASGGKQQVPSQPYPPRPPQSSSASIQAAEHAQSQRERGQSPGGPETANQRSINGGYFSRMTGGLLSGGPPRDRQKEENNKLQMELSRVQDELGRTRSELGRVKYAYNEANLDRQRWRESAGNLQNELKNVQRELDDYRTLSEVRGKELLGAQVFLTKADLLSVSEIVQKVSDLNDENFQAAAMVAEAVMHEKPVWGTDAEREEAVRMAAAVLGEAMLRILIANADEAVPNMMLVQLVMQMCLASFCCAKIDKWCESEGKTDRFLTKIYSEIRHNEEQAVTGRWRAITHKYTRLSLDGWVEEFVSGSNSVFRLAGWVCAIEHKSTFENNLKPIFKAILDLRVALGEQFTSADIEPYIVAHDSTFDPRIMEDTLDDARASKLSKKNSSAKESQGPQAEDAASLGDLVLGTTGIGLKEWIPRAARNGGEEGYKVTLSPKVILQTTLNELLAPPPPRKKSASSRAAR